MACTRRLQIIFHYNRHHLSHRNGLSRSAFIPLRRVISEIVGEEFVEDFESVLCLELSSVFRPNTGRGDYSMTFCQPSGGSVLVPSRSIRFQRLNLLSLLLVLRLDAADFVGRLQTKPELLRSTE